MMKWNVQYTKKSVENLKSIYEYIANILQEPAIEKKQITRIMDVIEQLGELPLRYHRYEKGPFDRRDFPGRLYEI